MLINAAMRASTESVAPSAHRVFRSCASLLFVFLSLQGNNPGCNTAGFTAVQGWDPITGLGTPNFERLASVVKNLP